MKAWASTLILLAVFGKLSRALLPKGEASPLHPPLKLLLSLSLVVVLFSPWMRLSNLEALPAKITAFFEQVQEETTGDAQILEQVGKTMGEGVRSAFPNSQFTLELYSDEQNIPQEVWVLGETEEEAEKIAAFIEKNYRLRAEGRMVHED